MLEGTQWPSFRSTVGFSSNRKKAALSGSFWQQQYPVNSQQQQQMQQSQLQLQQLIPYPSSHTVNLNEQWYNQQKEYQTNAIPIAPAWHAQSSRTRLQIDSFEKSHSKTMQHSEMITRGKRTSSLIQYQKFNQNARSGSNRSSAGGIGVISPFNPQQNASPPTLNDKPELQGQTIQTINNNSNIFSLSNTNQLYSGTQQLQEVLSKQQISNQLRNSLETRPLVYGRILSEQTQSTLQPQPRKQQLQVQQKQQQMMIGNQQPQKSKLQEYLEESPKNAFRREWIRSMQINESLSHGHLKLEIYPASSSSNQVPASATVDGQRDGGNKTSELSPQPSVQYSSQTLGAATSVTIGPVIAGIEKGRRSQLNQSKELQPNESWYGGNLMRGSNSSSNISGGGSRFQRKQYQLNQIQQMKNNSLMNSLLNSDKKQQSSSFLQTTGQIAATVQTPRAMTLDRMQTMSPLGKERSILSQSIQYQSINNIQLQQYQQQQQSQQQPQAQTLGQRSVKTAMEERRIRQRMKELVESSNGLQSTSSLSQSDRHRCNPSILDSSMVRSAMMKHRKTTVIPMGLIVGGRVQTDGDNSRKSISAVQMAPNKPKNRKDSQNNNSGTNNGKQMPLLQLMPLNEK